MKKLFIALVFISFLFLCGSCSLNNAAGIERRIDKIDEITLESLDVLTEIQGAYDALDEEKKEKVSNYSELEHYWDLYDALYLSEQISLLGEISLESQEELTNIQKLYDESDSDVKNLVSNYDVLKSNWNTYNALNIIAMIDQIGEVTLESSELLSHIQELYDASNDEVKILVSKKYNIETLWDEYNLLAEAKYQEAVKLANKENFLEAEELFTSLGDYGDSPEKLASVKIADKIKNSEVFIGVIEKLSSGSMDTADMTLTYEYDLMEPKLTISLALSDAIVDGFSNVLIRAMYWKSYKDQITELNQTIFGALLVGGISMSVEISMVSATSGTTLLTCRNGNFIYDIYG